MIVLNLLFSTNLLIQSFTLLFIEIIITLIMFFGLMSSKTLSMKIFSLVLPQVIIFILSLFGIFFGMLGGIGADTRSQEYIEFGNMINRFFNFIRFYNITWVIFIGYYIFQANRQKQNKNKFVDQKMTNIVLITFCSITVILLLTAIYKSHFRINTYEIIYKLLAWPLLLIQ